MNVSVRIRSSLNSPESSCITTSDSTTIIVGEKSTQFTYPQAIVTGSDQQESYNALALPILQKLNDGRSCTMFAYGQTGSGKTHTLFGPPGCLSEHELQEANGDIPVRWGILPRIMLSLLNDESVFYMASAIEIYQNNVFDLLADRKLLNVKHTSGSTAAASSASLVSSTIPFSHLGKGVPSTFNGVYVHKSSCVCRVCFNQRRESKSKHVHSKSTDSLSATAVVSTTSSSCCDESKVPPRSISSSFFPRSDKLEIVREFQQPEPEQSSEPEQSFSSVGETLQSIDTPSDVARFARLIEVTRVAHSHLLNDRSSRSHCLVRLEIHSHNNNSNSTRPLSTKNQFICLDLAGSERIEKSGSVGIQRQEAVEINQSLTALGRVIHQLGKNNTSHLPVRDSLLTMLLTSSFRSDSYISVVINLNNELRHLEETISSLRYGQSMISVKLLSKISPIIRSSLESSLSAQSTAQQRVSSGRNELVSVSNALTAGRRKLEELILAGRAGHFGNSATSSERALFSDNLKQMSEFQRELAHLKEQRAESNGGRQASEELNQKISSTQSQLQNCRDINFRQKTIRGLWIEPSLLFTEVEAEVHALEFKLQFLESH